MSIRYGVLSKYSMRIVGLPRHARRADVPEAPHDDKSRSSGAGATRSADGWVRSARELPACAPRVAKSLHQSFADASVDGCSPRGCLPGPRPSRTRASRQPARVPLPSPPDIHESRPPLNSERHLSAAPVANESATPRQKAVLRHLLTGEQPRPYTSSSSHQIALPFTPANEWRPSGHTQNAD